MSKLKSFLGGKNSLRAASLILIITLFLSNILGVIRDHFLTQKIPTDILSAYYAAFRIPDLVFNVLILGAISAAFIPVFSSLLAKNKTQEAWRVASSIINIALILLIVFCLILWLIMPQIIPFFVPGFEETKKQLTISLGRILLISPIFFGLSYIFGAILNSFKRFIVYSLAPLVYNLSIILGTLLFADRFGIWGVVWSVAAGAFLHMLIQLPIVIKLGFNWQTIIDFKNSQVRRIGILMLPRAIGLGANQILLFIFTTIASTLSGYAVAIYNLADNIQTMPMVVFGTSFAVAIFPTLSEAYTRKDIQSFSRYIIKTMRSIIFFLVPIVAGVILLRAQIVRLILGSGHFGWEQTIDTADTLAYFALSLVFTSLIPLLARAFYAFHNTKTPTIVTVATVIISAILGKILSFSMGVAGLALAFSIGSFLNALVLYLILRTKILLDEKNLFWFCSKVVIASFIMAVALQEGKFIAALFVNMQRFWGVLTQTTIAIIIALIIYFLLAWIFSLEEIGTLKVIFTRFIGRPIDEGKEPGR